MNNIVIIVSTFIFFSLHCMQESIESGHILYTSRHTLQQKCLIVLAKNKAESNSLPKNLAEGLEVLKKLHSPSIDSLTSKEIKFAFDVCGPEEIKKKVELLNAKKTKTLHELTSDDTKEPHRVIPEELNLFDSITWILNHCNNDIDSGLIQLSRYERCSGRKTLCSILLSLGANVNHFGTIDRRIRETTPLITSAIHKRIGVMRILLENGADPNRLEKDGYSPYTLIKGWQTPNQEMLTLLQQYGALDNPPCSNNNHPPSERCSLCALQ